MNINWYLIPMAALISLAWKTSRWELRERIVRESVRMFVQVLVGMLVIFLLFLALSWSL